MQRPKSSLPATGLLALLPLLLVLLLGGATSGVGAAHSNAFCQITPDTGVVIPAAPASFNLAMSMRDDAGGRTSAFEYYDSATQQAAFYATTPEGTYRAVVNFATKQILVVNMNETNKLLDGCKLQDLFSPDVLTPVYLGSRQYFLPSKFFFGGGKVYLQDEGNTNISQVPVRHYYSCYYWAHFDMSIRLNLYFTTTGTIQPIRAVVETRDNSNDGKLASITHDISIFSAGAPRWAARANPFMAPAGMYCRQLNSQNRKPQQLPDKFSMRIERIGLGETTSTYLKEAYDFKANMSLLLGYPPATSGDSAKYGAGKLLYIHDFKRSLSYIRNEDLGNCTYERLTAADWDSQKDGNQLRIRTPAEFFDLDTANVQYKGAGYTRDIYTDIFINYKQLDLGVPGLTFDTTIEWYFANRTYVDANKRKITQSIPMSLLISSEASWMSSWMYIYDFDQSEQFFNRHDISACFANDAKQHFQLFFPLSDDKVAQHLRDNPNDLTNLLIPILASGLRISPLRLLDPIVTVSGGDTAVLELTVTDKPSFQSDEEETPLREIKAAFDILIDQANIFTDVNVDGKYYFLSANRVSVLEERTNNLKSIGYTAGAVIGAAIGLLLAGLLAGLIAAFFYWR